MSYADPTPEAEAAPNDDNVGEAVNPPLPDGGPGDGTGDEATDLVPGDHSE